MDDRIKLGLGVCALALAVAAGWWAFSSPPETGAPIVDAASAPAAGAVADKPGEGPASDGPRERPPEDEGGAAAVASTEAPQSAEEKGRFVVDRVLDLFQTVDPSYDIDRLVEACGPDGRCTFRGPWPGDAFSKAWIQALADGRTSLDALQGVRFSRFQKVEGPSGPELVLTAELSR